jgi:hypothetical protein
MHLIPLINAETLLLNQLPELGIKRIALVLSSCSLGVLDVSLAANLCAVGVFSWSGCSLVMIVSDSPHISCKWTSVACSV